MDFKLVSSHKPAGGQPDAIAKLVKGFKKFDRQTLLGITGAGKTFMIANVIESVNKPTLVLAHNKTLAAQLYAEFKLLFPDNAVEYFVSYFDYYQPESYIPQKDLYIEKDSARNDEIERLRLRATAALMSRRDVIIVASISCIYGLGSPKDFQEMSVPLKVGDKPGRQKMLGMLVDMQYERNDLALQNGRFRVRGGTIDVIPGYDKDIIRITLEGDKIAAIERLDAVALKQKDVMKEIRIYPAKHFVAPPEKIDAALQSIKDELDDRLPDLDPLYAERLKRRTTYDLEMIEQLGFCTGIENYSRHLDGRKTGTPPSVLIDYFPEDFLFVIDESHQSLPQARGMYLGDLSRKKNLVDFGFRLPSALDNRPLKFEELEKKMRHVIFVSATPGDYEMKSSGQLVECIIRPTGLLDPTVDVRPTKEQIDDLMVEIKKVTKAGNRTLVTTLTKKMAEDLTDYLATAGIKVRYLHSEIETLERTEIIRELRVGTFDVLVGINLLREGIDIPEVALVAILDADKESYLRDARSLIQTIGRAARNSDGRVLMYADRRSDSMKKAIAVTEARREAQMIFNKEHGIAPKTISKAVNVEDDALKAARDAGKRGVQYEGEDVGSGTGAKNRSAAGKMSAKQRAKKMAEHALGTDEKQLLLANLEADMRVAAERLDFERAIELRDKIERLRGD